MNDAELTPQARATGEANRKRVARAVLTHASSDLSLDRTDVARWQRDLLQWTGHVRKEHLGAYRGSKNLKDVGVRFGARTGAPPPKVAGELSVFFSSLNARLVALLKELPSDDKTDDEVLRVCDFAAWAHNEWVRIHPFANGSGRTARLIANWILIRSGLSPAIAIRPRPGDPYLAACEAGIATGNHAEMGAEFLAALRRLENKPTAA